LFTGERFMLSADNLATFLNISKSNAYVLMNRADFPSIRIGRRLLVSQESLSKWITDKEFEKRGV
jgi:predicted DNA-binding transcriptional regulator AlpA